MKVAIVNKQSLAIESWYDADAANQGSYGGPWGSPESHQHIGLASGDHRAASAVLNGEVIELDVDSQLESDLAAADSLAAVRATVSSRRSWGVDLADQFSAGNALLGINTAESEVVLTKLQGVMNALGSGALELAIARAKDIDSGDYDAEFVTAARLLEYVNKIETYLGLSLSVSL